MNPLHRLAIDLRLLVAAGGIISWLLPVIMLALVALAFFGTDVAKATSVIGLLGGLVNLFWWMLGGARVLGMDAAGRAARLPRVSVRTMHLLATAAAFTALLPAALCSIVGPAFAGIALPCLLGASIGLALAVLPPWTSLVLVIGPSIVTRLPRIDSRWLPGIDGSIAMALLIAACLGVTTWAYGRATRRQWQGRNPWLKPLVISVQASSYGDLALRQQVEAQSSSVAWMQGIARPQVPADLRRNPDAAMAVALGPGFAPGEPVATLLVSLAMPVLLLGLWIFVFDMGKPADRTLLLTCTNLLSVLSGLKFMQCIWLLRRQPGIGLHELALLPGLGKAGQSATRLQRLLLRRLLAATLPILVLCWIAGLWARAPWGYYPLTVWMVMTGVLLMAAMTLLNLRYRIGPIVQALPLLALSVPLAFSVFAVVGPDAPRWLLSAWSVGLIAATILHAAALSCLRRRPHPWLQN